ncbi:MAG: DUF167 domain-containing protein [Holosporaceae bacterium]|nr:DUF167 domain-containing protein [Holosporaceae bacterium]
MSEKVPEDLCYEKSRNGVYLKVKVVPKSSKNEVVSLIGNRVRITVNAVPQNGEANAMLERVVADFFGIKKSDCTVTAGRKASQKTVFVAADVAAVVNKLNATFYGQKY